MSKNINPPEPDPDRHLKRIGKIFGVSMRIQKLALQRKKSPPKVSTDEEAKQSLVQGKNARSNRSSNITGKESFVLDMAAHLLNLDLDKILEGILDSDHYVELLNSLFKENGRHAILIYYREMNAPDSGRYNSKLKNETVFRAIVSDGKDIEVTGKCVLAYRYDNKKNIEMRTLADDICITLLDISKERKETSLSAIKILLNEITRPAVGTFKDFGVCKDVYKKGFFHGFDQSLTFLQSTDNNIENRIVFEVDNMLFKGHLLVPFQIQESSKIKKRVAQVEEAFKMWMRQMQYAIQQGNQIRRDPHDVGPLHELQYWRSVLAKYTSIVEFVASRPFCNYLTCLILSRSKIVKKWNVLDNEITNELNEAKDNVRYMSSMERFWDPLYRCEPEEIGDNLPSLMMTVRLIYKTSRFYNTSDYITGFLEKITNQIILACESYLTDRESTSIWKQDKNSIIEKIEKCKELQVSYRFNYDRTQKEMENSLDETPWHCSDIYIFGKMETFSKRLTKIKEIMNISMTYEILDRIQISGMEKFAFDIKTSIHKITSKGYNPLAHRSSQFDKDFEIFQKEVENSELGIQTFLKELLQPIPTSEARINVLKRFDVLNLDCLCLDRRYLEVAIILEKEIENLKDIYNEGRSSSPPIDRGVASTSGRIKWVRSLFKKMDDPMSVLKKRPCVIENKHSQLAIKYYNYLSGVMLHYEMVHHKAWYDYAGQVRNNLEVPIIKKNLKTNWLEINLNPSVVETIKESETILKLDLDVPNVALVLTYCKNKVINSEEILKGLIKRNNHLRLSIPIVLLPMFRVQLLKIETAFAPGLTTVTWLSQNLSSFFDHVDKVLKAAETLISELIDIKTARVDEILQNLEKSDLVFLPEGPVAPMKFVEANVNHRKIIEKQMQIKSRSVEMACIEIINRLVNEVQVSDRDENNKRKFQLPFNENAAPDLMRKEELLPIDKYDWINFEKLYKPVNFPNPKVHRKLCFKDYDGLKYDVTQLHNDCTELFAYFNHRIIAVLVKCTKTSLEKLKNRTNLTNLQISLKALEDAQNDPLFITNMELTIPSCITNPSIGEIQRCFANVIHNVVETQYGITTWGKQAKTVERRKHKPLIGEIRHERTWFKTISEHKEIVRYIQRFAGGLMLIQPDIDGYLAKIYNKFMYLWSDTRYDQIEAFVNASPMIADLREKFIEYDKTDEYIKNIPKTTIIGPIQINLDKAIISILIESKAWKIALGQKIELGSKERLKNMIKYITDNEKILNRKLKDLDDLRLAMRCLKNIREQFLHNDNVILLLEDTYDLFSKFEINTSSEDFDLIDGLSFAFQKLLTQAKDVSNEIFSQKLQWKIDVINGISKFRIDLELFDEEFEQHGDITENLSAKVLKDKILLMESKFEDMLILNEIHKECSKLFGLEYKDFPLLKSLQPKIEKIVSCN